MTKRESAGSREAPRKRQVSANQRRRDCVSVESTASSDGESDLMPLSYPGTPPSSSAEPFKTNPESSADTDTSTRSSPRAHRLRQSTSQAPAIANNLQEAQPRIVVFVARHETGLASPPTSQGLSHERTVIDQVHLPDGFQHSANICLSRYHPSETFPVFQTGNVFVHCDLGDPPMQWQLHSCILERHSSWFRKAMSLSSENSEFFKSWLFLLLKEHNGCISLVLQRVRPVQEASNSLQIYNALSINPTSVDDTEAPATAPTPPASVDTVISPPVQDHTATIELYNQIFGAFYKFALRIPSDTINTTLSFCESILKITGDLGCTDLIRDQIATALQAHRHALYTAIKEDPARWLKLAISLENDALYTEAFIHIVGAHPCSPWPTKPSALPDEIQKPVARKAEKLDQLCTEIERELLLLTIQVRTGPVQPQEHSQFDTWLVVQTFRDQLAREFHQLENSRSRSMKRGLMFRKIKQGGSSYMPYAEMRRLMTRIMPSAVENLEEDLGLMKEFASKIAEALAANELMLEVGAHGVGYLTCVKVRLEDMPWNADAFE